MKTASHHFHELGPDKTRVKVTFAGEALDLREGENLAAELMAAGVTPFRHMPVSGAPRNPFCMMGACFDCLVEIDGVVLQACMTEVRAEMTIERPSVGEVRHG